MRYLSYFIFLYLFLPCNATIDLISILLFFIILNENEIFSIAFTFFAGLLIDLYFPGALGLNIFIYLILGEVLIFLKKYFVKEPVTLIIVFTVFYLFRILFIYVALNKGIYFTTAILTIIFVIPIFLLLNKLFFRVWMTS